MSGYWNKPAETAVAFRDGWFHQGGAGYLDEAGYLDVDRLNDMIVTNGHNVYSAEVENALASHPAMASCAVIAIPDGERGERVHAVIVLEPETAAPELDELQRHCLRSISAYKVPRSCEFVDALPLSPIGKPLKRELREPYWSGMDRQVS